MNKIFKYLSLQVVLIEIVPSFVLSMFIAESFFKFGSFSIECLCFLGTWYTFSLISTKLNSVFTDYKARQK